MKSKFNQYSTEELKKEIADREENEKQSTQKKLHQIQTRQQKFITQEFINVFAPTHLTSCSDLGLSNGWADQRRMPPRCMRCALMQIMREGYWSERYVLKIDLSLFFDM